MDKPKVPTSKSKVPKSKSEVPNSKPKVPTSTSKGPKSKPKVLTSKSEVPKSKPEVPNSKPRVLKLKPEVPKSKPETSTSTSKGPKSKPKVPTSKLKPEVPYSKPGVLKLNPEVPKSKPKASTSTSKGPKSKPKVPNSKPEVPNSKSKVPTSTSKGPKSKPKVPTSKSEVPNSVPEIPNNTRKRKLKSDVGQTKSPKLKSHKLSISVSEEPEVSPQINAVEPQDMDEANDEQYEVEKILSKRCVNGKNKYLVKWVGYYENHNSWEPEENLNCDALVEEFNKTFSPFVKPSKESKQFRNALDVEAVYNPHVKKEAEKITGIVENDGERFFAMKWKDLDEETFVPCIPAGKKWPLLVIDFYDSKIQFEKEPEEVPNVSDKSDESNEN